MITKEVTAKAYVCEKCQKEYKNKSACEKHERKCPVKARVEEVFEHDAKFTYPTIYMDAVKFYRMCMIGYEPADHHVWINYNKQHSIGESDYAISSNNHYAKDTDAYALMSRLAKKEFFDFCDDKRGTRWDYEKKIPIHQNRIYVDETSLEDHDIYVTYEKGSRVKVDFDDPERQYGDGFFEIRRGDRIIKVEIFDKPHLEKEIVTSTHTLDLEMKDNLLYMKKYNCLYEFERCHYSVKEEIAREFLKKTKMDLSEVRGHVTLEDRRVAHNVDDWLDIKTRKVEHFQGSRHGGPIYGMHPYSGKTKEEAILNRAFSKADQRVKYAPQGRFTVGNTKVIMPDHHNSSYYTGDFNFFNEDTMEPINHKDMLKLLQEHNGEITVSYHE